MIKIIPSEQESLKLQSLFIFCIEFPLSLSIRSVSSIAIGVDLSDYISCFVMVHISLKLLICVAQWDMANITISKNLVLLLI